MRLDCCAALGDQRLDVGKEIQPLEDGDDGVATTEAKLICYIKPRSTDYPEEMVFFEESSIHLDFNQYSCNVIAPRSMMVAAENHSRSWLTTCTAPNILPYELHVE